MISCDWLSFSVKFVYSQAERATGKVELYTPAGCKVQLLSGTNIYQKRAIVTSGAGEKMLTLLWDPYSKIINKDSMFVEVANRWLYGELGWVLDFLWQIHPFTFQSLSRYDIACDFTPTERQMSVIRGLADNRIYVQGKREGSMFCDYSSAERVERVPRCISWGSPSANIHWKLYFKTGEIFKVENGKRWCEKPYIVDKWRIEGLNVDNVWRLEVSITSAHKFKYRDEELTWARAIDYNFMVDLFASLYTIRFVTRYNEGHKDRSNDKKVKLLDLEGQYRLRQREPKNERTIVELASTLRALMKQAEDGAVMCHKQVQKSLFRCIDETITAGHLEEYFFNTYGETWGAVKDKLAVY